MIFERHANLKYKYGNRHFWCRGYYVDTVGKNAKKIQEYIQNQLKEDLEYDQMTLKEYIDPFTGVRRHIVGGANRTLFSVDLPPRLCRTGT